MRKLISHTSKGARLALLILLGLALCSGVSAAVGAETSRQKLNLNADWRFLRGDAPGAERPEFDASGWTTVSCPHTWNDVDSCDNFSPGGHTGETELWTGVAWYRKEFTLPTAERGRKVFIEFEGVRQVADVYLNGHLLGQDKTGFIPFGFDLTAHLKFGERNVLAVRVDNTFDEQYKGDTPWNHPNWHPPHGGIYRNVNLFVTDPVHVTLPLYAHLQTEGIYAWTQSLTKEQATVGVTAEIQNEQSASAESTVSFYLIDHEGHVVGRSTTNATLGAGEKCQVAGQIAVRDPHLWEPAYPYLYRVRVSVATRGVTCDTAETAFGLRSFRFDVATGFWINGHSLKLHGWGQKPTETWAGLGAALPDWLTDYTLRLMQEAGGNFLRWGHCAGPPVGAECADKYGFVTLMPGVDGERDCTGTAWKIRAAAFRAMIIYYRNHPSICAWEGGNYNVSPAHAAEMREIVTQTDAHGQRYFGFRMSTPGMLPSIDLELGTVGRTRAQPTLPVLEAEYDRTETPRRVWDEFSPPDFGHVGKNEEGNVYHLAQEGFATNAIYEWWTKFGSQPAHSGGANWIFSDGPHGSRQLTEVVRASGEVDAVRLPKEAYWALQATWAAEPRVHLIGHWNYPKGTSKPMYAVAQADAVELFINGRSLGRGERSLNTLFTWNDVSFEPGTIKVVAYRSGKIWATQTKQTAGEPVALRLTPMLAPGGWRADGSDVALVDVEVVDAQGRRCPTDQARVDFEITGPGIWRGGYNSGKEGSINHLFLDTECGINRVSVRSTLTPGAVTLKARRAGLKPATLQLNSAPIATADGTMREAPAVFAKELPGPCPVDAAALARQIELRLASAPVLGKSQRSNTLFSTFNYTGGGTGGGEVEAAPEALAYSDDALLYLRKVPSLLRGARLIRTASKDNTYWANDYIVATTACPLTLFVAHDPRAPKPSWLGAYQPTSEDVMVNTQRLQLYALKLAKDAIVRIPGNTDQGKANGSALNLILFAAPAKPDPNVSKN